MRKHHIYLLVVVFAGTAIPMLLFSALKSRIEQKEQRTFSRTYKRLDLKEENRFEVFADVVDMKYFDNHLYLYDFERQQILKYASSGKKVQVFGKKGEAPGEFMHIVGWDIDRSGIYVADGAKLSISKLDLNGNVVSYLKLDKLFFVAHRLSDTTYLMRAATYSTKGGNATSLFWRFNLKTKAVSEIAIPNLDGSALEELAYEGFFASRVSGKKSFFVCKRYGAFFAFDNSGNCIYGARTIDKTPLPEIIVSEGSARYATSKIVNYSASSTEQYLFILSLVYEPNRPKQGTIIDVYDTESGKYLWSFELPRVDNTIATRIVVSEKQIFAYYGEKVVVFTYAEPR